MRGEQKERKKTHPLCRRKLETKYKEKGKLYEDYFALSALQLAIIGTPAVPVMPKCMRGHMHLKAFSAI